MTDLPSHRVSTRLPDDAERRTIRADAGVSIVSLGCATVLMLGFPAAVLAVLIAGLTGLLPGPFPAWAQGLLGGIVLLLAPVCARMYLGYLASERARRRLAERDARDLSVQVIEVKNPRSVTLHPNSGVDPVIGIDVGAGRVLLLQGQWLWDHDTYGAALEEAPDDGVFNGLPEHAFPSSRFVLSRLPHSGTVLSIAVLGEYVHPGPEADALPEQTLRDSELFDGTLDTLAEDLARLGPSPFGS